MIDHLILDLARKHILLEVSEGELVINAPRGALEPQLLEAIRTHKADLISYLVAQGKTGLQQSHLIKQLDPQPDGYLLSSSQQRVWTLSQFEKANISYNISGNGVFEGALAVSALEYAFKAVIRRHESLRTLFKENDRGDIRQYVYEESESTFQLKIVDLRRQQTQQETVAESIQKAIEKPFDLSSNALLRAELYQVADEKWILCYVMHHIVSDGWSMGVLINELLTVYNACKSSEVYSLPLLRIHYKDYAAWQVAWLSSAAFKLSEAYWMKQFTGKIPVLDFPLDKPRPSMQTYNGAIVTKILAADLCKGLQWVCKQRECSLFMGLLGLVNVLLYRYTNQNDIVVGTPMAGREHAELEDQIGFYVNTLALRTTFSGADAFAGLLDNIRQVTLGAYEHQAYPFDELIDALKLKRDIKRSALFDVMVLLQNFSVVKGDSALGTKTGLKAYEGGQHVVSKYDLSFYFTEVGDTIVTNIEYNNDIFERESILRIGNYLDRLLTAIVAAPSKTIDALVDESLEQPLPALPRTAGALTKAACSEHQKRLWFIDQFEKNHLYEKSPVYHNLPLVVRLKAGFNSHDLKDKIEAVVRQYPVLTTRVRLENNEPIQVLQGDNAVELHLLDVEGGFNEELLVDRCMRFINQPFEIEHELPVRFGYMKCSADESVFIVVAHHMIADRAALRTIVDAILTNCHSRAVDKERLTYARFSEWQNRITAQQWERSVRYWKRKLTNAPVLYLDTDYPREHIHVYKAGRVSRPFSDEAFDRIKALCIENNCSVQLFMLTVFNVLLYRYTGAEEVLIGTVYENRSREGMGDIVGPISNLITLRNEIKGAECFLELLVKVRAEYEQSIAHADMPFEKVVLDVNPEKDMSRTAIFDVLFHYEKNWRPDAEVFNGIIELNYGLGKYDLDLLIKEGDALACFLTFNELYFSKDRIKQLLQCFVTIAEQIANAPATAIDQFEMLTEKEQQAVVQLCDNTNAGYPADKTITHLFQEQVVRTPNHIALVFNEEKLTYRALNERANRFADYLRKQYAIQPDDLVGIKLKRNEWVVIAMLGVMKSGGAYLPIDPDYPKERIDFMIADSQCRIIFDEAALGLFITQEHQFDKNDAVCINKAADLAYVIYTSGTTGTPKGSLLEHRQVVRLLMTDRNLFDFSEKDVWTVFHSFCFDFSVWEMYGALLFGGRLVVVPMEIAKDPAAFLKLLYREEVTVLNQTPSSFYNLIKEELEEEDARLLVRYIIFAGEALSPARLAGWHKKYPGTKLINMYGITETTVHVTYKEVTETEIVANSSNIGRPLPTLSCYVLDKNAHVLPPGVFGELYVGGAGVSRGYLNRPDLTRLRFIDNPFKKGDRLYKSGDKARLLSNGELEYGGRIDEQVKVRGYRIECAEIENALRRVESIDGAVVLARKISGDELDLIAYVVCREALNIAVVREVLAMQLPSYMQPALFVQMDKLPLTTNGKVDKKNLPDPADFQLPTGREYIAPRDMTEEKLVEVWKTILGKQQVGVKDDFFNLGGHSLKATRLVSLIHKTFDARVSLKDIFVKPVLEDQAQMIKEHQRTIFKAIPPAEAKDYYPLSSAQRRLWVLSQFEEGSVAYNVSAVYVFEGVLDRPAFQQSFQTLINRHEILRTVFKENEEGEIKQFILPIETLAFALGYQDLQNEADQESIVRAAVSKEMNQSFDLSQGPLVRATVYQLADNKWVFLYIMHHIISDGWSLKILIRELLSLYNSYLKNQSHSLLPLRVQYKDYSVWQQEALNGKDMAVHKDWWLQQFNDELPVLDLPGDRLRPAIKSFRGDVVNKTLDKKISDQFNLLLSKQQATLFMGLLAAVNTLLYRYTGQTDIILGTPIAGRAHADLEDQIGFYVNTLAFRSRFTEADSFTALVAASRRITLDAYEHQAYPFDELIDALDLQRDMSRSPLFDVLIILQNTKVFNNDDRHELSNIKVSAYEEQQHVISKFDLTFEFMEAEDGLYLRLEYNTDIFNRDSIERMARHLEQLLETVTVAPTAPIGTLDLMSAEEKHEVMVAFNDTAKEYPSEKTLVQLFEAQAAISRVETAIIFEDRTITYGELNERANQLGRYLRQRYAVSANDLVAMQLERNEWLVVAMLGVLKAGAACVPINPGYPQERIDYMIGDSGCKVVIDNLELEKIKGELKSYSKENLVSINNVNDLLYVIYTSGSTGNPKGCMLENRGVVNHLYSKLDALDINSADVICHNSELFFVGGIWQLWAPLVMGGRVILCNEEELKDFYKLLEKVHTHHPRILEVIPSQLNEYLSYEDHIALGSVQTLILTGEKLTARFVNRCFKGNEGIEIMNTYGQTESSDVTTCYRMRWPFERDRVLAGRPIQNMEHYILSAAGALCGVGMIGEVCTSGDGTCRGYINQAAFTEKKFIPHPFKTGKRLYRTGDLGRWLPGGELEVTGRKDEQVKIRGYRVEPGEIEQVLSGYAGISEAVVLIEAGAHQEHVLVAYVVSAEALNVQVLRSYLAQRLPEYMIPVHYVQLKRMPLLSNGKVNKKELRTYTGNRLERGAEYVGARNETESGLVELWQHILQREKIGIKDNFFELGGHSLKATRLVSQVQKKFNVRINIKDVFNLPTIEGLGELIKAGQWLLTPSPNSKQDNRNVIEI